MNLTNLKNVKCSKISYHNVFPKLDIDRESHAYKNGGKRCSTPVAVYRSHDRAENKPANQSAVFQWKWRAGKTYSDWLAYLRLGHVTYIPLWPWPDFFHVCRASTPYYPGRLGLFVWAASPSVNCYWHLPGSSSFNPRVYTLLPGQAWALCVRGIT